MDPRDAIKRAKEAGEKARRETFESTNSARLAGKAAEETRQRVLREILQK